MANCKIDFSDDLNEQLSKLGEMTTKIVDEMLKKGGKICEQEVTDAVKNSIGKNTKLPSKSTGRLANSVKASDSFTDKKTGASCIWVGFKGHRGTVKKGTKLAKRGRYLYEGDIAYFLEYGTSKMAARPFIKKASKASSKKAAHKMEQVFEQEVQKLGIDK